MVVEKVLMFGWAYEVWAVGLRRGARGPLKGFALTVNPLYDGLTAEIEASKSVGLRSYLQ